MMWNKHLLNVLGQLQTIAEREALNALRGLRLTHPWRRRMLASAVACLALFLLFSGIEQYVASALPPVSELRHYAPPQTTRILASDGTLVGQLYRQRRTVVPLQKVPRHVIHAFLAAEDAGFYEHGGIDYLGIARAALKNLRPGARRQGASTITQQTIKALVLGAGRSYSRKVKEALLARRLDSLLSKDEILHIYLNEIYLGAGAYGIEEGAQTYFGKSTDELTLAEGALLAGIPKHPSRYNPRSHPIEAEKRRDYVLQQMQGNGWISAREAADATSVSPYLVGRPPELDSAPHYVEHVRRLLIEQFGVDRVLAGGLEVHTGLIIGLQEAAHRRVRQGIDALQRRLGAADSSRRPEAALVAIDPQTHSVRALVGGYDLSGTGFNRATQASRQPGSAFKPIVYAAALAERIITPATLCPDAPVVVRDATTGETWKPENYSAGHYSGLITYRTALMRSVNTCSVRLVERVGVHGVIEMAHMMGIESDLPDDPTVGLGSGDLSPLELATAYTTIAAGGRMGRPIFIHEVLAPDGELLFAAVTETQQALEPGVAFVLTSMLRSVVEGGTGSRARAVGRPIAGKTGTSNESRNLWFSGFSPQLVATVWVGYDDNSPVGAMTGGSGALPIWTEFMSDAHAGKPTRSFTAPPDVHYVRINPQTGAQTDADDGVYELFVQGTEPTALGRSALQSIFFADDSSS